MSSLSQPSSVFLQRCSFTFGSNLRVSGSSIVALASGGFSSFTFCNFNSDVSLFMSERNSSLYSSRVRSKSVLKCCSILSSDSKVFMCLLANLVFLDIQISMTINLSQDENKLYHASFCRRQRILHCLHL